MTVKHTGIFIGLFLIGITVLFLEIEDKIRQPEIVIFFISGVLTIGVALILYTLVKRTNRGGHQEN